MKSNLTRFSFTLSICIPKTSTSCWVQYCQIWKSEGTKGRKSGVFHTALGVSLGDA